jgi:hypothetical protein
VQIVTCHSEAAMQTATLPSAAKSMSFDGADLEVRAKLGQNCLTIDIMKAGNRVHRVTINDAVDRLEHGWLAGLFAREHHVELATLVGEVHDYVDGLNTNQG